MAEATGYSVPIKTLQGGKTQEIGSSGVLDVYGDINLKSAGEIDVESGGHIDLASGGYIAAASGGYVTLADGSYLSMPVVAGTTATALTNFGISTIASTGASKGFTSAAPAAGLVKALICTAIAGTSAPLTVTRATTTFTIDGGTVATFDAAKDALFLVGVSATAYWVLSNVGTVATS